MARRMLFAAGMFALIVGSASQASAQVKVPQGWDGKISWGGSIASSAHQDGVVFGFYKPVRSLGQGYYSVGGEVRIGYEYGYSGVQYYLGTFRYTNENLFKWPSYIDVYGGIEHFDGGTIGYFEPAAGLVFPWGFGDFRLIGQIGMPVHFYSGNAEVGFSGQVGFKFPFMNK
jgi:hypothetical protein